MKKYYNKEWKSIKRMRQGELVMLDGKDITAKCRCKKWEDKMYGPFEVVSTGKNEQYCMSRSVFMENLSDNQHRFSRMISRNQSEDTSCWNRSRQHWVENGIDHRSRPFWWWPQKSSIFGWVGRIFAQRKYVGNIRYCVGMFIGLIERLLEKESNG